MTTFFENDPTLQSYWRSIILYGRNVASYKFALGKALIDLNKKQNDLIKLEELADPFSNHLCQHLKHNEKQITSANSEFLNILKNPLPPWIFESPSTVCSIVSIEKLVCLLLFESKGEILTSLWIPDSFFK